MPQVPAIVVEGTRRQREELLLLGVVQHPVEVLIVAEEREQLGRVHGGQGGAYDGSGSREIALSQRYYRPLLDHVEVGRGEREAALRRSQCLGIAAEEDQRPCGAPGRVGRAGVERGRPREVLERGLPAAQRSARPTPRQRGGRRW